MAGDFRLFEEAIERVFRRRPGAGKQAVLRTRLYCHLFRLLDDQINRTLAEYGLNSISWVVLMMIYSNPRNALNPSALSEVTISSRTHMTRVADSLEKSGWVVRHPCTEDRRRVELSLTSSGVELVERLLPAQRRNLARIWRVLGEDDAATLERLLRKLMSGLARRGPG